MVSPNVEENMEKAIKRTTVLEDMAEAAAKSCVHLTDCPIQNCFQFDAILHCKKNCSEITAQDWLDALDTDKTPKENMDACSNETSSADATSKGILPCPYCGGETDVHYDYEEEDSDAFYVSCHECGMRSPCGYSIYPIGVTIYKGKAKTFNNTNPACIIRHTIQNIRTKP